MPCHDQHGSLIGEHGYHPVPLPVPFLVSDHSMIFYGFQLSVIFRPWQRLKPDRFLSTRPPNTRSSDARTKVTLFRTRSDRATCGQGSVQASQPTHFTCQVSSDWFKGCQPRAQPTCRLGGRKVEKRWVEAVCGVLV